MTFYGIYISVYAIYHNIKEQQQQEQQNQGASHILLMKINLNNGGGLVYNCGISCLSGI